MAVPKRRMSRSNTRSRRAQWKTTAPALVRWFGLDAGRPTYGRLALIHCDQQPAIELLEVVAPES